MKVVKSTEDLKSLIVEGIKEKKGKKIISLNFSGFENSVCKYFIICEGDSNTHVNAISQSVEDITYKKSKIKVWKKEGFENAQWIILDYVDIVVHIFQKHIREYYNLEELWADTETESID